MPETPGLFIQNWRYTMLTPMLQVEADVVFVVTNKALGTIHVRPIWECELFGDRLYQAAQWFGLAAVESDGAGDAEVQIYDYRSDEILAECKKCPANGQVIYNLASDVE
jgi:hypothetical protein